MNSLPPIPVPLAQRWRQFRMHVLPVLLFVALLASIIVMWRSYFFPKGRTVPPEAASANTNVMGAAAKPALVSAAR